MAKRRKEELLFSSRQAAWLSELPQKIVDKTIERGELPARSGNRELNTTDVLYLAVRRDLGDTLASQGKRDLYDALVDARLSLESPAATRKDLEVRLAGGAVRVDLKSAYSRVAARWQTMSRAVREVVQDPYIRAGEPVIRGTRIPVYMIGDLAAQGADESEILEDYPALDRAKLQAALAYVETHPKRGRPRTAWGQRKRKTARPRK